MQFYVNFFTDTNYVVGEKENVGFYYNHIWFSFRFLRDIPKSALNDRQLLKKNWLQSVHFSSGLKSVPVQLKSEFVGKKFWNRSQ